MATQMMTPRELGEEYGIAEKTLTNWRYKGVGPKWVKLGAARCSRIRYRRTDVETWLDEHARGGDAA